MPPRLRPIGHDDRLSIVEHLDELRTRLIICLTALAVAFGFCVWQRGPLLEVMNRPLDKTTQGVISKGKGPIGEAARLQQQVRSSLQSVNGALDVLSRSSTGLKPADRKALDAELAKLRESVAKIPTKPPQRQPVTLGVGEPFTTTLGVSAYFALLFALPVILYQLYAFILPAFSPRERRVATPLIMMVPFLFAAGVIFGYFMVLPPAIRFLQNFNDHSFEVLVQANQYYRFEAITLAAMGALFQVPVGILALTRAGIVTPRQLRKNRRYAILVIAVLAMLLPGTDPVTMVLSMLPLVVLFEAGILLAAWAERMRGRSQADTVPAPAEGD